MTNHAPTKLMVCLGDRLDHQGKKAQAWLDLNEDLSFKKDPERWSSWGTGKALKQTSAGGIFRFTQAPNGNGYTSGGLGPTFIPMYDDRQQLATWQLASKAANLQAAAARFQAKQLSEDHILNSLAPLRRYYQTCTSAEQRALLVLILEYLAQ